MTTLPDGSPLPGTRVRLLQLRADALRDGGRAFTAVRDLQAAGWMALASFSLLFAGSTLDTLQQDDAGVVPVTIGVLLSAVGAGESVRRLWSVSRATARLRAEEAAWLDVDRTAAARDLPRTRPGETVQAGSAGLRTPWDARDDADLDAVCVTARLEAQHHALRYPVTTWVGLPLVLVLGVLLLGVGVGVLVDADSAPSERFGFSAPALPILLPALARCATLLSEARRRSVRRQGVVLETLVLLQRRDFLADLEPRPWPHPPRAGQLVGLVAVLALVVAVLAGPFGLLPALSAATAGLVVIGVIALATHQQSTAGVWTVPLLARGDDVRCWPPVPVELDRVGAGLRISTPLPRRPAHVVDDEVLFVHHDHREGLLRTPAVALVLRDATPVVLSGRGVAAASRLLEGEDVH